MASFLRKKCWICSNIWAFQGPKPKRFSKKLTPIGMERFKYMSPSVLEIKIQVISDIRVLFGPNGENSMSNLHCLYRCPLSSDGLVAIFLLLGWYPTPAVELCFLLLLNHRQVHFLGWQPTNRPTAPLPALAKMGREISNLLSEIPRSRLWNIPSSSWPWKMSKFLGKIRFRWFLNQASAPSNPCCESPNLHLVSWRCKPCWNLFSISCVRFFLWKCRNGMKWSDQRIWNPTCTECL